MIFHIVVYTPNLNNSNYTSHLLEHTLIHNTWNYDDFFYWQNTLVSANTYTFCTEYTIKWDESIVNKWVDLLCKIPIINRFTVEKKSVLDELSQYNYSNNIFHKLWQYLYWKSFKHAKTWNISYNILLEYHKKYYRKKSIIIIERDMKFWICNSELEYIYYLKLKISINQSASIFYTDCRLSNIYILYFLSDLLNSYLVYYNQTISWMYNFDYTFSWEFEKHLFLSIPLEFENLLLNIDEKFINFYINNKISKFKRKDLINQDWVSMILFWFSLENDKIISIIKNLNKYYSFITQLK
jgi:hypothetical protein